MNDQDRAKIIREFVHTETYLKGLQYRVRVREGECKVEFLGISTDQLNKLRNALDARDCQHIQIVRLDSTKKKRRRKRKGKANDAAG